jgi:ABC-type bacteriocin/lantibiotic exporter with double-glycine peptidase domain
MEHRLVVVTFIVIVFIAVLVLVMMALTVMVLTFVIIIVIAATTARNLRRLCGRSSLERSSARS